ncbi:helix-turn-helix domain-containing protein [Kitasatospora sp. NBC_01246]
MNTALHRAMGDARVSVRQLATHVGVTPKTVERWLTDEALVPHARNRVDASEALGVSEAMLWPNIVRTTLKTGPDREIVAVYPYRSACTSAAWGQLISDARDDLFFAGFTNYFLWLEQPNFLSTLRAKAEAGCRVRFLLGDPNGETTRQRERVEDVALTVSTRIRITLENLAKLRDAEGLEARYSADDDATNHVGLSVFRFDSQALVTPHLARFVGHDSPMMHLRRQQDGGMFDRFTSHAEELWDRGVSVPTT